MSRIPLEDKSYKHTINYYLFSWLNSQLAAVRVFIIIIIFFLSTLQAKFSDMKPTAVKWTAPVQFDQI